jgi:HEAT repeat protein
MPLTFRCSNCLDQLFVADQMMGQQCRCGRCSTVLVVPPNAVYVNDPASSAAIQGPSSSAGALQSSSAPVPVPAANSSSGSGGLKVLGCFALLGLLGVLACGGIGAVVVWQLNQAASDLSDKAAKDVHKQAADLQKQIDNAKNNQPKIDETDLPKDTGQADQTIKETEKDTRDEPKKDDSNQQKPDAANKDAKPPTLKELTQRLTAKDTSERASALKALADMGPEARPALVPLMQALRDSDPDISQLAAAALKKLEPWSVADLAALKGGLRDKSPEVRNFAVAALKSLGANARPALTDLLHAVGDEDAAVSRSAGEAVQSLEPMTATDVPVLVKGLADKSTKVQIFAVALLKSVGPAAKKAAAPLGVLVIDGDTALAAGALEALAKIGPDARAVALPKPKGKTVYDAVLAALEHKDEGVRTAALDAVDKLGPAEERDLPALRTLLKRRASPAEPRRFAAKALASFGTVARPALEELLDAFRDDPDLTVRQIAGKSLVIFAPELKLDALVFSRMLEDEDADIRAAALQILAGAGDEAKVALDPLIGALQDKAVANRALAAAALAELGADAAPALDGLLALLMGADAEPRKQAAIALGRIGSAARAAVPALLDAKAELGDVAEKALNKIGPLAAGDVPVLTGRLDNAKDVYRILAAKGLGALGDSAVSACPALVKRLTDPNKDVRAAVISALIAIGPKAENKALEPLCKALVDDAELQNRLLVLQGLPKVAATKHDVVVKALAKAMGDADVNIRVKAATALGEMGAKAKGGAAVLGKAVDDKEEAVVKASLEAIAKLGPDASAAAPELLAIIKKAPDEKQLMLLKVLGDIGSSAKAVIVDLAAFGFKDKDNKVLFEATLMVMEQIGPGDLKLLYAASKSATPSVRIGAITSLEKAATKDEDRRLLLDNLRFRLNSSSNPERDPTVRAAIAEVIGRLQRKS